MCVRVYVCVMCVCVGDTRRFSLDPGLLVVQVPEELVQAVGFVELCASATGHALDLGETAVDGVALVLDHRGVEGDAAHQAVRLPVEVFQAVLRYHRGKKRMGSLWN